MAHKGNGINNFEYDGVNDNLKASKDIVPPLSTSINIGISSVFMFEEVWFKTLRDENEDSIGTDELISNNHAQGTDTTVGTLKSGATQVAAGAAAGELWRTVGHATLPDNVVMVGV